MTDDNQSWEKILGTEDVREFFGDDSPHLRTVDVLDAESILRSLEEQVESNGWDQPPVLLFLRATDVGAELLQFEIPDEMVANFPVEFGRFVQQLMEYIAQYRDEGPHAQFVKALQDQFLGASFQGIILSTEGWTVAEPDHSDTEALAAWRDAARRGAFHEHPERVEMRITTLLTTLSDFHVIKRVRDAADSVEYAMVSGNDWEWGAQGSIAEALRIFVRACIALNYLKGWTNDEISAYWSQEYERAQKWALEQQGKPEGEEKGK